ncbi:MAG: hypothetical protein FJW37_06690 [Acidobacteria bacterium]|nr:hypothetical protein [Acidobacteriota bacterium]
MRAIGQEREKYAFTAELVDDLRRAYDRRNRRHLSRSLDRLVRRTGWPRHAFTAEARRRGWSTQERRPWTERELRYLREHAAGAPLPAIARKLRRPVESVRSKADQLALARRVGDGYTISDLQTVFGVTSEKVRLWLGRGLFGAVHEGRHATWVTSRHVIRFLRKHPSEYDLRRVDQAWYKGMLLGELAGYGGQV